MRVDWCVSSWFRIKKTHSHTLLAGLPACLHDGDGVYFLEKGRFLLFVSPNSHERRASPQPWGYMT